ncbi:hypothetical protein FRB95_010876, partial [Tulasnella sp. JGI-2019a]
ETAATVATVETRLDTTTTDMDQAMVVTGVMVAMAETPLARATVATVAMAAMVVTVTT